MGLAQSGILKRNTEEEINRYAKSLTGATGSRLISGNLNYTEDLEKTIANFHNADAGLIFNSGYDANMGLFSSLPQRGDTIITDELIHASIIDGARLSHANRYTFKHNDLESLESKLKAAKGICYVAIESVYSMDGDTPPLLQIVELTEKYNANLIIDEAHAIGLHKQGLIAELGLNDRIFARVVTFGKALGCHGAIVLGSNKLREYLINFARSFIYTTAAPFHNLATVKMAYELLQQSDVGIGNLRYNITLFKKLIVANTEYPLIYSDSSIQCILLKSNYKAREIAAQLQNNGLDVRAILSPTVAQEAERIRICLHSYNTEAEITLLANTINQYLNEQ